MENIKGATIGAAVGVGEGPALDRHRCPVLSPGWQWGDPAGLGGLRWPGRLWVQLRRRGQRWPVPGNVSAPAAAALHASPLLPQNGASPSLHPTALAPRSDASVLSGGLGPVRWWQGVAETTVTPSRPACRCGTRWHPAGHLCAGVHGNRHRRWVRGCQDDVSSRHSRQRRSGCRQHRGHAAIDRSCGFLSWCQNWADIYAGAARCSSRCQAVQGEDNSR